MILQLQMVREQLLAQQEHAKVSLEVLLKEKKMPKKVFYLRFFEIILQVLVSPKKREREMTGRYSRRKIKQGPFYKARPLSNSNVRISNTKRMVHFPNNTSISECTPKQNCLAFERQNNRKLQKRKTHKPASIERAIRNGSERSQQRDVLCLKKARE